MLYEVAKGKGFSKPRGILIHEDELYDWVLANGDEQIGMSIYGYRDQDKDILLDTPVRDWMIQAYLPWFPIDIDKGDTSDEGVLNIVKKFLYHFDELGLREENYKLYFSGRGYHIMIHGDCFGFPESHQDLELVVRLTKEKLLGEFDMLGVVDHSIYHRKALIRCPHSINEKSNLYKIPITRNEALTLKPDDIKELAKSKRLNFNWPEHYGDGELASYVPTELPKIASYEKVIEPYKRASCIYNRLVRGPIEGSRHIDTLILSAHFASAGVPSMMTKEFLLMWNNKIDDHTTPLEKKTIIELVEQAYRRGYDYSCNNAQKRGVNGELCSTRCIHYSERNHATAESPDPELIIKQAKKINFVKMRKEGLQIGAQFGVDDFAAIRGEVISLLGVTKAGKTTLMKNLLYGVNMHNNTLLPIEQLRKTYYYSSEQPSDLFYFTALQMLEDVPDYHITRSLEYQASLYDKWKERLSKVVPIEGLPTINTIKKQCESQDRPEIIVIDTIDHAVAEAKSEHQGIKDFMVGIQQIAQQTGIIFFLVSQTRRDDSREGNITLFSGKGSGSIENQSRKVLSIKPSSNKSIKIVEFLADTYAPVPEDKLELFRTRGGRFKIIYK